MLSLAKSWFRSCLMFFLFFHLFSQLKIWIIAIQTVCLLFVYEGGLYKGYLQLFCICLLENKGIWKQIDDLEWSELCFSSASCLQSCNSVNIFLRYFRFPLAYPYLTKSEVGEGLQNLSGLVRLIVGRFWWAGT